MSIPLSTVIQASSLKTNAIVSGEPGMTHTVDENVEITNDLHIGVGPTHTGTITMNGRVYTSKSPNGTHTTGGIATWDAAQHFSICGGKEIRFYNYDKTDTYSSTAFAGIKSSTETPSSGYTLTLPSGVTGKSGQYLMLSDNTGTLQWNSIAGATSPLASCKVATTASFTMASTASSTTLILADGEGGFSDSGNSFTQDGVSLSTDDRILIKDGVNSNGAGVNNKWNGIYTVGALSGSTLTLTRALDFDENTEITQGSFVYIESGSSNSNKSFIVITDTSTPITVGITEIEFSRFSVGGLTSLTSGTGLSAAGGDVSGDVTINIDTSHTSIVSIRNNNLKVGGNSYNNYIDFSTDDTIRFAIDGTEKMKID